jgi:zinc/manganese transport system substrate-binding protein
MNISLKNSIGLLLAASTALSLAGCTPSSENAESTLPTIVATTNVWADVAQQVAGDNFEVVALISDPAQDPHSYEASARDQLAVAESSLFIMNGGGYDDFALTLASAAGVEPFNVYEVHEADHANHAEEGHAHTEEGHTEEGHAHAEEGHTEEGHAHEHAHDGSDHIWYDFHVVEKISTVLAAEFAKLQPESSEEFTANAAAFQADLAALETRRDSLAGELSYFEAHPLASLLFKDLGYTNVTPEGFAAAEEAELEPSVAIVAEAEALIASGTLGFIAVNEQVTSQTMDSLRSKAEAASIPVLELQELLPPETSYQDWANSVLDQIESVR